MTTNTTCHLCSASRPIAVNVANGKYISARTHPNAPKIFKYYCPKLNAAPEIIYSAERLKAPMYNRNRGAEPRWEEISWETALSIISEKLKAYRLKYGPESLVWLTGHVPDYGAPWDYANRFMNVFGSPNIFGNGSICHAAREMAHVLTYGAMTRPDYENSRLILIWGKNDKNTQPAAFNQLLKARRQGAKIIVVDPVQTKPAALADIWLQIKPGGDGLLAMSMIHVIIAEGLYDTEFIQQHAVGFEPLRQAATECSPEIVGPRIWLNPRDIRAAARLYATSKPACMIDGNGLDMNLNVSQNMRAVCILRALSGNLDVRGGDLITEPLPVRDLKLNERRSELAAPLSAAFPLFRNYHTSRGDHIFGPALDAMLLQYPYPVKAVILQGTNPVVSMANANRVKRALRNVDFLVVIDLFMTRSAKIGDMVLPAATPFETTQLNLRGMASHRVVLQNQVIDWYADSRPDWRIIFDLAKQMGFEEAFPWNNVEEAIDDQLAPCGLTVNHLRQHPVGIQFKTIRYRKYRTDGFDTPSGKIEFFSERLEAHGFPPLPSFPPDVEDSYGFKDLKKDFPLIGITGSRSANYVHSQYRNIPSLLGREPEPFLDIHSVDAKRFDIHNGQIVRVETPNGQVKLKANITRRIPSGCLRLPWGWGEFSENWNVNCLTDDSRCDPITSTTSNRSFFCRIIPEMPE